MGGFLPWQECVSKGSSRTVRLCVAQWGDWRPSHSSRMRGCWEQRHGAAVGSRGGGSDDTSQASGEMER
ncbi:hypothetical protein AHAS_Ahas19G0146500 [Arachis hypogaea]